MPLDRQAPDSPAEWLNRAASDLAIAQTRVEGAYLEDLCYHAQQCAEKAFKAVLLHRCGSFPYIHDLAELVNRIEQAGIADHQSIGDGAAPERQRECPPPSFCLPRFARNQNACRQSALPTPELETTTTETRPRSFRLKYQ